MPDLSRGVGQLSLNSEKKLWSKSLNLVASTFWQWVCEALQFVKRVPCVPSQAGRTCKTQKTALSKTHDKTKTEMEHRPHQPSSHSITQKRTYQRLQRMCGRQAPVLTTAEAGPLYLYSPLQSQSSLNGHVKPVTGQQDSTQTQKISA